MADDELSALYLRAERECGFGTDTIRTHWDGCACRQLARVEAEREVDRLRAREAALLATKKNTAFIAGVCGECGTGRADETIR